MGITRGRVGSSAHLQRRLKLDAWSREYNLEHDWRQNVWREDFKQDLRQALRSVATAEWMGQMLHKSTLTDYRRWKTNLDMEDYLSSEGGRFVQSIIEGKRLLTRFRGGASGLRVDTGRWEMFKTAHGWRCLPKNMRTCMMCFGAVEDPRHVLLNCPAYDCARNKLLSKMGVTLGSVAQNDEFIRRALFGNGKQLAMAFLRTAMKKRSKTLQDDSIFF